MSTVSDKASGPLIALRRRPVFWRFVWKEYRMLRGLWLAVAVIGFVVQLAEKKLLPPSSNLALTLFFTALAAAVLYAAGAAATTFSVEHEEQTYDFLAHLPAAWSPVFAGKLLVAAISSLSLALALSISGWLLSGGSELSSGHASEALTVLGFGIVEALAWGTLFSLLIKRPLLAAILTLVVGMLAVNVAVNFADSYSVASLNPEAYRKALPLRLAVVVVVLACSVSAARRWLVASGPRTISGAAHERTALARFWALTTGRLARLKFHSDRRQGAPILSRLLWQTWRECWKLLLFPVAVGGMLIIGISAAAGLTASSMNIAGYAVPLTLLFIPALYGAMAFYADQCRGSYRFLAEHAARPRYVWLARHLVWLGTLVGVGLLSSIICSAIIGALVRHHMLESFNNYAVWGTFYPTAPEMLYDLTFGSNFALRIAGLSVFGALVAYGIGQFCSMAVRSEILAAFVALLLSTLVVAWSGIAAAWQLSGWLFLLPLFLGFMAATWLRAPDWIARRNSWRTWLKPALAVVTPFLLIGIMLPAARLRQVSATIVRTDSRHPENVNDEIAAQLRAFNDANTPAARVTAQMYIRAAEFPLPEQNFLEPWEKPEYMEAAPGGKFYGIDQTKIPADQLDAFQAAKEKQLELIQERNADMVKLVIEASKRPACHFDFDTGLVGLSTFTRDPYGELVGSSPLYQKLNQLTDWILFETNKSTERPELTKSFDRLLAALRVREHLRAGQPTIVFADQLFREQEVLRYVGTWAAEKARTKDELRDALAKLIKQFTSWPTPTGALLADHLQIRDVITGKDTPLVLAQSPIPTHSYLAYLANELPWERERALRALNRITLRNVYDVQHFINKVQNWQPRELAGNELRSRLRHRYSGLPELWEIREASAATSYLVSLEYRSRVLVSELNRAWCDNEVCRRAAMLQIGLAMYRQDHQAYPPRLADLVPAYLKKLPPDPYSSQPFAYEPAGLELELQAMNANYKFQPIKANTPLFWSVGAGNVRLKQVNNTRFKAANENEPEGEAQLAADPVYVLMSDDWPWGDTVFAFPLPK